MGGLWGKKKWVGCMIVAQQTNKTEIALNVGRPYVKRNILQYSPA